VQVKLINYLEGFMKFLIGLLVFTAMPLVAKSADLPVFDKDFACISQADANRYVSDFKIDVQSFGGLELCDAKVDTKKLFNDLQIIEKGRFASTPGNLLVKNFVPADQYYSWMREQTEGINRGDDIPYATAYNSFGYFTMQDGWAKLSTLGRVGTVIHEARHTEGYRHIQCTHGPYEGSSTSGCDKNYSYSGSHAIEMEYYGRVVVQGENFHPVYKTMARLMAMGRANFVFNQTPIKAREVLTLVDRAAKPYVLDGDSVLARDSAPLQGGVLKRTSPGASVYFGSTTVALDLYSRGSSTTPVPDDYSYFKLLYLDRGQGPEPLKDMEEFDLGTRRFAVGLKQDGTLATYLFAEGKWSPFTNQVDKASTLVTTTIEGQKGLFVRLPDGTLQPFDPLSKRLGTPLKSKWPSDTLAAAVVNGKLHALNVSGLVYVNTGGRWDVVESLKSKNFDQMVSSPVYDAFEVAP
jgi:hypothetical protein